MVLARSLSNCLLLFDAFCVLFYTFFYVIVVPVSPINLPFVFSFPKFFEHYSKLLNSDNYVTKRQSLKVTK